MAVLKLEFLACSLQGKIFWFPGVRVYGESFGFPGMWPGFMPKNRKHPPSLLFSLVRKTVLTAPPGRLHCAALHRHAQVLQQIHRGSAQYLKFSGETQQDLPSVGCELVAQDCSVPIFNRATFLLMISMVVFKHAVCYSSLL